MMKARTAAYGRINFWFDAFAAYITFSVCSSTLFLGSCMHMIIIYRPSH